MTILLNLFIIFIILLMLVGIGFAGLIIINSFKTKKPQDVMPLYSNVYERQKFDSISLFGHEIFDGEIIKLPNGTILTGVSFVSGNDFRPNSSFSGKIVSGAFNLSDMNLK